MKKSILATMAFLLAAAGPAVAADAEEFARELGATAATASACSRSLGEAIAACLDQVIEAHGFTGEDADRLRRAYQTGFEDGPEEHEESHGCGDILRDIRKEPFWARCPDRLSRS